MSPPFDQLPRRAHLKTMGGKADLSQNGASDTSAIEPMPADSLARTLSLKKKRLLPQSWQFRSGSYQKTLWNVVIPTLRAGGAIGNIAQAMARSLGCRCGHQHLVAHDGRRLSAKYSAHSAVLREFSVVVSEWLKINVDVGPDLAPAPRGRGYTAS